MGADVNDLWANFGVFVAGGAISYVVLTLLLPLLRRHALAQPNLRSSHKTPTPQGGGFGIVPATLAAAAVASFVTHGLAGQGLLFIAVIFIAAVGAFDDVRDVGVASRLLLQAFAVAILLASLPADLRIVSGAPCWLERVVLLVGVLWFVNLTNFMDGIDWMTVAETVPVAAGLALFGVFGALPSDVTIVAFALCGATIGFAPFNRPIARLFLGDVGSLPIGLLTAWMLIRLAGAGHVAAALLLPLYYLVDATLTLLWRMQRGEPFTQPHRRHFYQYAFDRGLGVYQIVGRVFLVNIALVMLAATTLPAPSPLVDAIALVTGCVLVGLLLYSFTRARA